MSKKRVLISVSDKTGIVDFAKDLVGLGYEIISTGGTKAALEAAGIDTISISEVTGFPEIMDGRVKTLHPNVHGALLCVRDNEEHKKALEDNNISYIDMVVVNLYPFKETLSKGSAHEIIIENIDIGGPSMLRSGAKNYKFIPVIVDSEDYEKVLAELKSSGETTLETREALAAKVFRHTAAYDCVIAQYLTEKTEEKFPESFTVTFERESVLRYGENPHQEAAFYSSGDDNYSLAKAEQLHGKELSYNNIQDTNAALAILAEFDEPCVVAVKHMNPCGVGLGVTAHEAWQRAYEGDTTSIFGGIVAYNREVDEHCAKDMSEIFLEVIVAPSFSEKAIELLTVKKNIRLLTLDTGCKASGKRMITQVGGGVLLQDMDRATPTEADFKIVTKRAPSKEEMKSLVFAQKVAKHIKSNAISLINGSMVVGVGAGQMNRVGAAKIAIEHAGEKTKGAVMGSDAFFPMPDTVEAAAAAGITAIIQPGGSIKDDLSIEMCDRHNIAMVFTGTRHFKH